MRNQMAPRRRMNSRGLQRGPEVTPETVATPCRFVTPDARPRQWREGISLAPIGDNSELGTRSRPRVACAARQ
jgi:hypothetical protein